MTQAVPVRRDGDAFQSRVFWSKAARLLDPASNVIRVGFESGPKGFDDVWVDYNPAKSLTLMGLVPLGREHIQCKWHGTPDTYGFANLSQPEFINANAVSLLERALKARRAYTGHCTGARFRLLTNWRIERSDPLKDMMNERSQELRLERLFAGGDRSKAGQIRKNWRDHLSIDDDELRGLAGMLALSETTESLEDIRERLNDIFGVVGLRRIPANESTFGYDDLPYQWAAKGRLEFDRKSFIEVCSREGLLSTPGNHGPKVYGVKSFEHKTDKLEDRCTAVLNLVPSFNERQIRPEADWATSLYPALSTFLLSAARPADRLRLILDAHLTLSFAAGSVLDIKSGRIVELEQRIVGKTIWSADDTEHNPLWCDWSFEIRPISGKGKDIVVAIGVTHDLDAAVSEYVKRSLPDAGQILSAKPSNGHGATAICSGHHAFRLAESLTAKIRSLRTPGNAVHVHIFLAAPGGFSFFLGQRRVALGPVTLYEFDYEENQDGSYQPSLSLPV